MIPSQLEIVKRLSELSRLLDAATVEVAELDEAAVRAKAVYEVEQARAFLAADGAMDARKAQATVKVADYWLAVELAQAQHRACKERINTLRSQLSIGQTLSTAIRTGFSAEGAGQWT